MNKRMKVRFICWEFGLRRFGDSFEAIAFVGGIVVFVADQVDRAIEEAVDECLARADVPFAAGHLLRLNFNAFEDVDVAAVKNIKFGLV